ncbi:MAG: ABC transporter ATP-binding protein [Candidatus Omnitrophota bacterium]
MGYLAPYRREWLVILALSVAGGFLSLGAPFLTRWVVDVSLLKKDFKSFLIYAFIGGGLYVLGEILNWSRYWLERTIRLRVNFDLNRKIFQHLQSLSYSWFQRTSAGEHIFTVNYDIETVTEFITSSLPQLLSVVPRSVCIIAIVFYFNWKMALCALLLAPFLFLPGYLYSRIMEKLSQQIVGSSEKVLVCLQEIFSHMQLIKVWGAEKKSARGFLHALIANIRVSVRYLKPEIASGVTAQIFAKCIMGLIGLFGGYLAIKGDMTLGTLAAIMVYLTQLIGLQSQIASFWQANLAGIISCKRVADILDTAPLIKDGPDARSLDIGKGDIRFKGIGFGYVPGEFVVKNLSFSIRPGEHVALAGPSGKGKTTLLSLMVRLYDLWEGDITFDGCSIRSLSIRCLKDQIGVAMQEHFLWDDTIHNNITYRVPWATVKEVEDIGRVAGLDDLARALPLGYQTMIGENACRISEGQKQKIAIARALFKKPRILILDEAMSAMDSQSEEMVLKNIRERYKSMTVIIVSHRFSTLKGCDRALYLAGKDTLIEGNMGELLRGDPGFRRLFAGQLEKE